MRIRFSKFIGIYITLVNIVVFYYGLQLLYAFGILKHETPPPPTVTLPTTTDHWFSTITKKITVVIREFDPNENDIPQTVQSFIKELPGLHMLILYDELPYPPLDLPLTQNATYKNVQTIHMSPDLKTPHTEWYPISRIKTKYVLFVPDSVRLPTTRPIHVIYMESLIGRNGDIIAVPFVKNPNLKCLNVYINPREWTLKYSAVKGPMCDAIAGKHMILMRTEHLRKLSHSFLLPFPQSLYIQTAALGLKVSIYDRCNNEDTCFYDGKPIFKSHHAQWRKRQKDSVGYKKLYQLLHIKQVVQDTGMTEWHGCSRESPRCFPPVLDQKPSYMYEGKWTPPCCLANLRKTAKHVFNSLEEAGIRYWLEAGSLLGAMRNSDILPWDYDVDVGFNSNDLSRSPWLTKAKEKPTVDTQGFLWEKATEGNFFRVYYSKANKINVNLFPFCSVNGTMIKDSWYTSHKNMEFPDNFLHPMSSIEFMGRHVPSPNNIRDFLELKFGKGCIENTSVLGF